MTLEDFLYRLGHEPHTVTFEETMAVIDRYYNFTPVPFTNGDIQNAAGQNSGSCKIFGFALLHGLKEQQTLHCFGNYYRNDVLGNPGGSNHGNIRQFMETGWNGIHFDTPPLTGRATSTS